MQAQRSDALIGADGPRLPTPAEGDLRGGVAREGVKLLLLLVLRPGDMAPEFLRRVLWRNDDSGSGVNNRLKCGPGGLPVHRDGSTTDLPKASGRRQVVELDPSGVQFFIYAADKELGSCLGELEGEYVLGHGTLFDSSEEVGILGVHEYGDSSDRSRNDVLTWPS